MLIDILIILWAGSAIYRGRKIGLVQQLFSVGGFVAGLLAGVWLQQWIVQLAQTSTGRTILSILTVVGCGLLVAGIGEYVGTRLKKKLRPRKVNAFDNGLGGVLSLAWVLASSWLLAALIMGSAHSPSLASIQTTVRNSLIIGQLNRLLPPAPDLIAGLGRFIDPNSFPDVFIGQEPAPQQNVDLPSLGELGPAVNATKKSVVRLKGEGCGGIVSGSGFVGGKNLVVTNAHVVAGIDDPYVQDSNGNHRGQVIWFDPKLDFAVVRVAGLAGVPLTLAETPTPSGTAAAILGYPGGGDFAVGPAAVLRQMKAIGRDIYGEGRSVRDIYELQADVQPGNSGGPVIGKDGTVLGLVFAEATNYNHVAYALTASKVKAELALAAGHNRPVQTGQCTAE